MFRFPLIPALFSVLSIFGVRWGGRGGEGKAAGEPAPWVRRTEQGLSEARDPLARIMFLCCVFPFIPLSIQQPQRMMSMQLGVSQFLLVSCPGAFVALFCENKSRCFNVSLYIPFLSFSPRQTSETPSRTGPVTCWYNGAWLPSILDLYRNMAVDQYWY